MKIKLFIKRMIGILYAKLFLLLLFLPISTFVFAQENFVFENFSIPQGLSNPTINCVYEDKYGFLWLGTNNGLNRYDGYEFKVFKNNPSDSTSLPGNSIRTITEDKNGNMWIGGSNVLAKYDRKKQTFKNVKFGREQNLNQPIIRKIFIDSNNKIWVGTDVHGLHLLDPETMTTKRKKFILNNEEITNGFIFSIIETSDHELLAADYGSGIFFYSEKDDEFKLYKKLGSNEAGTNILAIYKDDLNRLWMGGGRALSIYDQNTKSIERIEKFSNPSSPYLSKGITSILKDKDGFIWLATRDDGLYRYNPVTNIFFHFVNNNKNSIKSNQLLSLLQDSFGNIWVGTSQDGLYKVDPNKQPMNIIQIPNDLITNSPADRITSVTKNEDSNNLAMGTAGLGLFWGNIKKGEYKNFRFGQNSNSISNNTISALTIDTENNLWVGSNTGLYKINTMSGDVKKYFEDKVSSYRPFNILDLKFDKAGRLFVAYSGGVDILYPNQNIVKKIPTVANREFKRELISEIIKLTNSTEPIASILKVGEQKILEKEFRVSDSTKILIIGIGEGQVIFEIMSDFGWLENENKEIIWGMHKTSETFHFQGGNKNRIMLQTLQLKKGVYKLKYLSDTGHSYGDYNVQAPGDSVLWGIQAIRISDKQFSDFSKRINESKRNSSKMLLEVANTIFLSKFYENVLWVGSKAQGFFKYNLSNGNFTQYKNNNGSVPDFAIDNDIYNILEDSRGIVWFSSPYGLGRLNPRTEKIKYFTEKDGLPTNLISDIQEDNFGNLWISSSAGLTTMVRNADGKKETFINIDIKDGLQGYSFSRASWKTKNGELFFGGDNGVNYFTPGRTNLAKPKIVLTDFRISDVSIFNDFEKFPLAKELNNADGFELNYSQNNIAFQFSPIHYSRPERNLIAYKLEGFNKDWVYSKLHFASFTNLQPGEYIFKLKAANGDGVWSDEEKSISIEIMPPYWRTNFAYISYVFLFLGIVFGIDRYQRKRLLSKARERARIKESEMRTQIAEAENERKTKELEEARDLQLSMLPKELPQLPNIDIAVYMQTATEVGGDYYDFYVDDDGTLTAVLGDATGHGMKAGTIVTITKSLFHSLASGQDILSSFEEISRVIKGMNFSQLSMCLMMLKIKDNQLSLSSAAIPPALIYRNKDKTVEEIIFQGMPLGAMKKFPYTLKESILEQGDTILLLSDGLPELTNDNNEMYGYDRTKTEFHSVGEKEPEEIVNYLKNSASQWGNGKIPDDDITFVVIKVKGSIPR